MPGRSSRSRRPYGAPYTEKDHSVKEKTRHGTDRAGDPRRPRQAHQRDHRHPGRRGDPGEELRGRPRHRLALHGRDRRRRPGRVRRRDPRRPAQEPQDGQGRHQLHPVLISPEVGSGSSAGAVSGAASAGALAVPPGSTGGGRRAPETPRGAAGRPAPPISKELNVSKDRVRVVVTGLGATTPVGGDVASSWSALLEGRSGIQTLTEDWVDTVPVKFAGPAAVDPATVIPRPEARRLDRAEQFALIAAREAWKDAGSPEVDPDRL